MATVPSHHLPDDVLISYAAGAVNGGKGLMVATHLAFCPVCRAAARDAEGIAALLLEAQDGIEDVVGLDTVLSGLGEVERVPAAAATPNRTGSHMPWPLCSLIGTSFEQLPWQGVWFGVREYTLNAYDGAAKLLWIPAGRRMPRHDHEGEEWTLVLKGAYRDQTGHYAQGDVQEGHPGLDHQPIADKADACVCLVVTQGDLRLSGWLGHLVEWRSWRARG